MRISSSASGLPCQSAPVTDTREPYRLVGNRTALGKDAPVFAIKVQAGWRQ